MTELFLAVLSPENVLRLMSKNGHGIEERAALALGYDLTTEQLFELTEMLALMTNKPEAPAIEATKPKATKPKAAKPKPKVDRARHNWLLSPWLIRFIHDHDHLTTQELGPLVCDALGREDSPAIRNVLHSRLSNLVKQKKLARTNGHYDSTDYGMRWANEVDPQTPPVADGQELLAD